MTATDLLKKYPCEIIEDLLPIYAEHKQKQSNAEISTVSPAFALLEDHLKSCASCQSLFEIIQEDFPQPESKPPDITPIHFRRKYHIRLALGTACSIVAAIGILAILLTNAQL